MALRVLQVLEATEGGTRTHLRDLALGLDPRRFTVDLAVSLGRDPGFADDLDRFRAAGLGVDIGPMVRPPHPAHDAAALAWLRGLIRRGRYDIVHGHSSKAGFLGRLAARLERVPVRLYTPNAWHFLAPDLRPIERALTIRAERVAAGWGTHLIATSAGEAEAALRHDLVRPDRLTIIPNGIDVARLDAQAAVGGGRDVMQVADDATAVLTVGRRAPQKGDRFLLEAWPAVLAARPEAVLVLVGDGPLTGDLQARAESLGIAGSVRWLPRQENVGRLYAAADLYVLPSLYEGCPYTVLEAMATGLPVVATTAEGSRDVIEPGRTGWLVPPGDSAALGRAMVRALTAPGGIGAAARETARRHYTVERMVAATAALYERLARAAAR